ncbi:SulP family inorganic anion transporter [Bacteroidota bacterium]
MNSTLKPTLFKNFKDDIPASVVVFLVAMPLCLGIAMASGAPLFSGIIAGIIGGIVVGALSGSPLGVSGPAAGLAVIVLNAITDLGSFQLFLTAVVLAGVLQLILGYARAGIIAHYFPSSVIHGMLAGIGVLIFLKQIPHAFGYDGDYEGDFEFFQPDGQNTFSELFNMMNYVSPGIMIVSGVSLFILILWDSSLLKQTKFAKFLPGPLIAVVAGIGLNVLFQHIPQFAITKEHLVSIPLANGMSDFAKSFSFPDFSGLTKPEVYITAVVIAIVASLETLLCVEATDKLDPQKRVTPTSRELKAQGVGNLISGLIGGLPVTQVIVRSSANLQTGGKSKLSTILHGFFLLGSVILIPQLLNLIPLATLAAILLVVGYKLAKPALFKKMYSEGKGQFIPFLVTVCGIVLTDLLMGIGMGMVVAIFIILRNNYTIPYAMSKESLEDETRFNIVLSQDVTFLNKAAIQKVLSQIPDKSVVMIDASNNHYIHHDVVEIIEEFKINAETREIEVSIIDLYEHKQEDVITHFEISNASGKNK